MDQGLRDQIISVIDETQELTFAAEPEEDYPQATTVNYINDGLTIYFAMAPDSQEAANIMKNNKVSVTINRHSENRNKIKVFSITAEAKLVSNPKEQDRIGGLLFKKFPQLVNYIGSIEESLILFRLDSKVVSIIDYKKDFERTDLVRV